MKSCIIGLVLMSIYCAHAHGQFYPYGGIASVGGQLSRIFQYGGAPNLGLQPGSLQSAGFFPNRGLQVGVNANQYVINSGAAVTSTSGWNANGIMYYRDTVENTVEDTIYRTETFRWPSLDIVNEFRFEFNLTDPTMSTGFTVHRRLLKSGNRQPYGSPGDDTHRRENVINNIGSSLTIY